MSTTITAPTLGTRPGYTSPLAGTMHKLFSFPAAVVGVLSALGFITQRGRFNDPEMWRHLKIGQLIWASHAVPLVDPFSFTAAQKALIPHEWLTQLAMYSIWHAGGTVGLMFAFCCLTAAILVAGYVLCTMYSQNSKVSVIGALVLFVFAIAGFSIRPQVLGYLFLIIEMIILHLGRSRNPRLFLALVPLFALWVNCHASFFIGLSVIAALLASSFFKFEVGSFIAEQWSSRRRKMLALSLVLSAAATLANPGGYRQVLYPLNAMLRQHTNLGSIQEWQPLELSSERGMILFALMGAIFLLITLRKAVFYLDELVLLGLGLTLAGSHTHLLFVFGIVAAPIFSRMISRSWDNYHERQDRMLPNAILIALSLVAIFIAFPSAENLAHQIEEQSPVGAVAYIHSHSLPGPMLNEYGYGGYLIWAAPDHPVFIDGRLDLYESTGIVDQFAQWATMQGDPNGLLEKFGIQFCLLSSQSPMVRVMPLLHGWKQIYTDHNSVIFARDSVRQ